MSLATYYEKRNFKKTREPKGKVHKKPSRGGLKFVVQEHHASRLHYDFRLELDGVLKSWAVPKGPSTDPARKALAVQTEDHPLEYAGFHGDIPEGEYGAGHMDIWDQGTWAPSGDPQADLDAGKLRFTLKGRKLKGEWSLVKMHGKFGGDGKTWLLFKLADRHAGKSVSTKSSTRTSSRKPMPIPESTETRTGLVVANFAPQLAVLSQEPPKGNQWVHEIKFDGYRILAHIKKGKALLITRNGNDWTDPFAPVAEAIKDLKVDSAIVDGEVVVLNEKGQSDFQALQQLLKNKRRVAPTMYAFDLPFCNGQDLRRLPLLERKKRLEKILKASKLAPRIRFSQHVAGEGKVVRDKACQMGLEGIISKLADGPYYSRRDASWLKSKCDQRQEFIIIGFTDPQGSREAFGSLAIGYYDDAKKLAYAGKVGTGFNTKLLKDIYDRLKPLEQKEAPDGLKVVSSERKGLHWVEPKYVCEVRFTGWTQDGNLRHPTFIELRSDKAPSQVKRERAVDPDKVAPKVEVQAKKVTRKTKAHG
jgi:bifunctional non-homologous end joining protein LigD